MQQRGFKQAVEQLIVQKGGNIVKIFKKAEKKDMQQRPGDHGHGARHIVFLPTQYIPDDAGQRRHAEQQDTKPPIPTPIKKITGAHEENNPLFF